MTVFGRGATSPQLSTKLLNITYLIRRCGTAQEEGRHPDRSPALSLQPSLCRAAAQRRPSGGFSRRPNLPYLASVIFPWVNSASRTLASVSAVVLGYLSMMVWSALTASSTLPALPYARAADNRYWAFR